ncbi:MAG: exo-alpha-sialidase [Bacillati bacterium ANGP1]|uniref:Exo-alpha-sialidase n=1 Tax=Candidatus Segetimicrobium genomatis TaxID=2569760 RepID=A0A537IX68_9BACT|nr:MAG: exo-alpha-sialidase [Terrabacteria group bacterium ANGP1]
MSQITGWSATRRSMRAPARGLSVLLATALALFTTMTPGFAVLNGDTEIPVGSNDAVFSQNKQNEPAIAVDASHTNVLAVGDNDNIDLEACNVGDDRTCPFTHGVGVTGIQFSFDSGSSWIQPTYTGFSARGCLGTPGVATDTCTPSPNGPIGTLPWYFEEGLVSNGDPALAFGPQPGPGGFSWANGSRLYVANLTGNFSAERSEQAIKGVFAVGVSRIDGPAATGLTPAIVADKDNWKRPVIASKQSSTAFSDKEQIWADNAASSDFFGNVYVCYAQFRSAGSHKNGNSPAPLTVLVSRDGGDTWDSNQLVPAGTDPNSNNASGFGISGCTIRTDSAGVVYVFGERFAAPFTLPTVSEHVMFKSTDGGKSWTHAISIQQVTDPCFFIDPVIGRCVMDGIAGARNDLAAAPSVDIANGAPTGAGATNLIVDAWADGGGGPDNEGVMVSYSRDGGQNWSAPTRISSLPDRGYYVAPAVSPDGQDVYVAYNAFTTPFRNDTTSPRSLVGVVKHADVAGAVVGTFTEIHRGVSGDPRGSSQNTPVAEFLGDYVYAIATRDYAAAVWNDVRNASDCPAMDDWRFSLRSGPTALRPAPQQDCPSTFGNSDIFGGSWADPSP